MDKVDLILFGIPVIMLTVGIVCIQEFILLPKEIKSEEFDKKYPIKCVMGQNQTYIQLNANDRIDFRSPEMVCGVSLRSYVDDNGTWQYVTAYQYEAQSKYNKPFESSYLNCKPKIFDNKTGNFVCIDGTIAKEFNNDY